MDLYGYSAEWLAHACGVNRSTARRWKRRGLAPARYTRLLELAMGADLGCLAPAWRGWRFSANDLVSPEGERLGQSDVRALRWVRERAAELERQLRRVTECAPRATLGRELVVRVHIGEANLHGDAPIEAVAQFAGQEGL